MKDQPTLCIPGVAGLLHYFSSMAYRYQQQPIRFANNIFEEVGAGVIIDELEPDEHLDVIFGTLVLFDIDRTIVVTASEVNKTKFNMGKYPSLQKEKNLTLSNVGVTAPFYSIYKRETGSTIKRLLQEDVKVGFFTHGMYDRFDFLPYAEEMYGMSSGELSSVLFWNRFDCGDKYFITPKSDTIIAMQDAGMIGKDDRVILVDDNLSHISSARIKGFDAVHATGFFSYDVENPSPDYLEEIFEYTTPYKSLSKKSTLSLD